MLRQRRTRPQPPAGLNRCEAVCPAVRRTV